MIRTWLRRSGKHAAGDIEPDNLSANTTRRQWLRTAGKAALGGTALTTMTGVTGSKAASAQTTGFVDLSSAQTVAGIKTFTSAPVVPDGAFPESAVANLIRDLAGKQAAFSDGTYIPSTDKGAANGVAGLGKNAKLAANQGIFVDVTRAPYYAQGDGTTDDTTALQSALSNNLRVYLPNTGRPYKTGQLVTRPGQWIMGEARSGDNVSNNITRINSQVNGFSSTPNAIDIPAGGVGLGAGVTIENIWLQGLAVSQTDYTPSGYPSRGIRGFSQTSELVVRDCVIAGFNYNIWLMDSVRCVLERLLLTGAVNGNVVLYGQCTEVRLLSSHLRVVNESGRASTAASLQNIWLQERSSTLFPFDISIRDCLVDELARGGQSVVPASVRIDRASDVVIDQTQIYTPINGNQFSGGGGGYGVRIGANARRVALRNVRVAPYALDPNHVPLQTIYLDPAAAQCSLTDITTVTNGGGDIADNAVGTAWLNVNGVSRLASYAELVPVPDPGAPAPGAARLFLRDKGSGKSELVVRFSTGLPQVIAGEP